MCLSGVRLTCTDTYYAVLLVQNGVEPTAQDVLPGAPLRHALNGSVLYAPICTRMPIFDAF